MVQIQHGEVLMCLSTNVEVYRRRYFPLFNGGHSYLHYIKIYREISFLNAAALPDLLKRNINQSTDLSGNTMQI